MILASAIAPSSLLAFGTLAEFLDPAGSIIRSGVAYSTDIIASPKWNSSATNIVIELCTAGAGYAGIPLRYQTSKDAELLADIQNAVNTWNAVAGGPTFGTAVPNNACDGSQDSMSGSTTNGHNRVSFKAFPMEYQNVLAITKIHMTASGGVLTINESDIQFNNDYSVSVTEGWTTRRCHAALLGVPNNPGDSVESANASCSNTADPRVGFRGVLTHELGHLLGLSHSMVNDDKSSDDSGGGALPSSVATMFPAISNLVQSTVIENLATDDVLSKKNLYGLASATTEGTISGTVRTAAGGYPLRAAHIYAFDLVNQITLAGTFSGVSGTLSSTLGEYTIAGLPLNTPFILIAEPIDRTDVHPNLRFDAFNTPVEVAIRDRVTALQNFAVEAYPDVPVADIRKARSIFASPGISSAQIFTLTTAAPSVSGANFYLSAELSAPNDAQGATIAFNSNSAIDNSNPLVITITAPGSLNALSNPSLALTATKSGQSFDWSSGVSAPTWAGTQVQIAVDPTAFDPSNGSYTIAFSMIDSKFGAFAKSANITVSNWTKKADLGGDSGDSGGGGGCLLRPQVSSDSRLSSLLALLGLLITAQVYFRRRLS